jgi:branched-chain amino acid transport system permease protein
MSAMTGAATAAADYLRSRHRFRVGEAAPWLLLVLLYYMLPGYLALGSQIVIMVLFALSLDLILGYAGIVSLGHAAFFGVGAYAAALLAKHGWSEPITGLMVAAAAAALIGVASG